MKKCLEKLCYSTVLVLSITLVNINIIYAQVDSVDNPPNYDRIIPAINFKNADIRDILRGIALEYKTNILIDNRIDSRISIALFNTTVFDAVSIIAEDNKLEFEYDKNRFYVKVPKEEPKSEPKEVIPDPVVLYDSLSNEIEVSLYRTDISRFVEILRTKTDKNYLLVPGTSGTLNGALKGVDLIVGLRNIFRNNGYYITSKDSIYYISRSSYFSGMNSGSQSDKNIYWVSANNGRVTIDVNDGDINSIVDDLANQLNLQIIKLKSPTAKATIKCTNVTLNKALSYLFKGTEFTFKEENDTYIIGSINDKNLDNIKLVRLLHLRADLVSEKLPKELFNGANIAVSTEHNALIVTGPNEVVNIVEDYISKIDHPVPQVMIEALVVDYNLDNLFEFGIDAGRGDSTMAMRSDSWYPGLDVTASGNKINSIFKDVGNINLFGADIDVGNLGKLPEDFFVNIRMLEQDGVANIKSRPLLSTLNGNTAYLKIGTIQNYVFKDILPVANQLSSSFIEKERVQQIEATISFEITPWVGPNNQLTLNIKPDFQTPVGEFSPDKNLIPAINTRTLESTVRLKDGETIVLGGLIQDIESTSISKFPYLGDIPYLGELFTNRKKQKTKAELVIYLTPRIFYDDDFGYAKYEYSDE